MTIESLSPLPPDTSTTSAPVNGDALHRFSSSITYQTVDNPAFYGNSNRRISAVTWAHVLAILVVALVIDIMILTIDLVGESPPPPPSPWAPLPTSETVLSRIFFGSCSSQLVPQPYWDTLVKLSPDLVVLMGDNVYGDCNDTSCTNLRQAYRDWDDHPSFSCAKPVLPMVATLDDHDYGLNDCHAENPYKHVAKQMFIDFFNLPIERNRHDDGVYGAYEWGPHRKRIQLLLLDTRFSRSPFLDTDEPMAPGKELYIPDTVNRDQQMLSPNQWTWLEEQVQRPVDVRLVVSSIQVLAEGSGLEAWRMLPYERARLLNLLHNQSTTTTLILSGDRHVGGFYQYENLTEVTASSWTHSLPFGVFKNCSSAHECDEVDGRRVGDLVRVNNFGSIEFDWDNRTMTVSLRRTETSQQSFFGSGRSIEGDAGKPIQSFIYPIQ